MPLEKATALVIRNTDFSESSRISTLWTRELGKVRVMAKGGRRLKSSFESGLDLLSVCSIVLLRKTSGSLDLLTEAQVLERFIQLRHDLAGLYAGYYLAELLNDLTEDYDPHPTLFEEALQTLRELGQAGVPTGPRLARFELVLLKELGYGPALDQCAMCMAGVPGSGAFSPAAGGVVCAGCQGAQRDRRSLPTQTLETLRRLRDEEGAWKSVTDPGLRQDLRTVLNLYVTYLLGRQPRLLPYLGS